MNNTAVANMSLTQFWKAQGKSHARDGKPFQFKLNERQEFFYTQSEKVAAQASYLHGYQDGLPELPEGEQQ